MISSKSWSLLLRHRLLLQYTTWYVILYAFKHFQCHPLGFLSDTLTEPISCYPPSLISSQWPNSCNFASAGALSFCKLWPVGQFLPASLFLQIKLYWNTHIHLLTCCLCQGWITKAQTGSYDLFKNLQWLPVSFSIQLNFLNTSWKPCY